MTESRRAGKLVRFADPFGELISAEEFVLRWDDGLGEVRAAYRNRVRVSVDLALIGPQDRVRTVDGLDALVKEDDGELWETSETAWLLTPRDPKPPESPGGSTGGWPSGDREPRIPTGPTTQHGAALDPPTPEAKS